jgi:hypothetical protein
MIIRVRTQLGTWKIKNVVPSDTIKSLRDRYVFASHHSVLCVTNCFHSNAMFRLEQEHSVDLENRLFSASPGGI